MKLAKNMNNGQRKSMLVDLKNTFPDGSVTASELFEWATNSGEFYKWFYTRFEVKANLAIEDDRFHKFDRSYNPMFMEWCAWEIIPCIYADFIGGLIRELKLKCEHRTEYIFGGLIYDYYLKHFKECLTVNTN